MSADQLQPGRAAGAPASDSSPSVLAQRASPESVTHNRVAVGGPSQLKIDFVGGTASPVQSCVGAAAPRAGAVQAGCSTGFRRRVMTAPVCTGANGFGRLDADGKTEVTHGFPAV